VGTRPSIAAAHPHWPWACSASLAFLHSIGCIDWFHYYVHYDVTWDHPGHAQLMISCCWVSGRRICGKWLENFATARVPHCSFVGHSTSVQHSLPRGSACHAVLLQPPVVQCTVLLSLKVVLSGIEWWVQVLDECQRLHSTWCQV
jgi:hypothetical protein